MPLFLDDPMSSLDLFGGMDDPADTAWNPDNWLVQQVDQLTIPASPQGGPRVRNEPNTVAAPLGAATSGGSLASTVDAAYSLIGTPYVWGGTSAQGIDCSGLVYYAFKAAGYNMERYRAVDYGHMGTAVAAEDGRPGDVVYFDNPGSDTDHVGIYLGDGKFIEAPQPGGHVEISDLRGGAQLRRIVPDGAYTGLPTTHTGNLAYHAPDGKRYVGAVGPGPQRDPVEQIMSTGQELGLDAEQPDRLVPDVAGPEADDEFGSFLSAVSGQESGGDYSVENAYGAIGKYQIMYYNVGAWTLSALGRSMSPEEFRRDPEAQEAVARWRLGQYVSKYGYRGAAAAWYSGDASRANDYAPLRNGSGPSVGDYVDQVMARIGGSGGE